MNLQNHRLREVKMYISLFYFAICFRWSIRTVFYLCSVKSNLEQKFLLKLIKRRSKVHEKNMPRQRALNFDYRKTFFESYQPIRIWLCLVYKITENNYYSQLFTEFIHFIFYHPWQNKYSNLKTTCHIKPKVLLLNKLECLYVSLSCFPLHKKINQQIQY